MRVRRARHVTATLVGALGVADLVLAAGRHTHVRATAIAIRWAEHAVIGARFLLLVAGLTLVLVTRGLLHGKRNAWRVALVVSLASLVGHHLKEADAVGLGFTIGVVAVLLATRTNFTARSDPALVRRGVQLFVAGELTTFVYGTLGLYLLDRQFRSATTLAQSAGEAFRLLLLLPTSTVEPTTRHGSWFIDSVRVAALGVVLASVLRLMARYVRPQAQAERQTVERLLDEWATTPLAYFHLLGDKTWLVAADRRSFVGFKLVGTTAVALGEPIGAPDSCQRLISEFVELCELNGWTVALHQVGPDTDGMLAAAGLKLLKIGEEAVIDLQHWNVEAKEHKQLRSALRRVERAGMEVAELPQPIDEGTMAELRQVSDSWRADGSHRERTFTLGQFDAAYLRATIVLVVRERESHRIVAFANVLPSYRSRIGNFDLMRRTPDAPNGVMEYLFVALIDRFRAGGCSGMTLGLAPMANIVGDSLPERALRLLYVQGNRAFNYQGLHRFKDKWGPTWEPRFLAYRSDGELPKIAAAVIRAGELPDPARWRTRLRSTAERLPFTLTIASITVWLMAATAFDKDGYPALLRLFGLGWHDLVHLQLWRLPTAQLLQTRPGFVWGNVALCFLALPAAEWRLGTTKTIAYFYGCDWISSVVVLIGVRIAAAGGQARAAVILAARDAGPSAGAWALVIATTLSFSNAQIRRSATGIAMTFLVASVAIHHRLFDTQHLLSASLALGATLALHGNRLTWRRPSQLAATARRTLTRAGRTIGSRCGTRGLAHWRHALPRDPGSRGCARSADLTARATGRG